MHAVALWSVYVVVPKLVRMLVLELPRTTMLWVVLLTVLGVVLLMPVHVLLLKLACVALPSAEHRRYHQQRFLGV